MFKIKCTLMGFMNDVEKFPCHFDYEIGESFTYDGCNVEGRICPGVLLTMVPTVWHTFFAAGHPYERILFKYSGLDAKDPSMKQYDGIGFRPLKEAPAGSGEKTRAVVKVQRPTGLVPGTGFACADCRTSAYFSVEPVDIASGGYALPFYKRQMDILEKVKASPGMTVDEILQKYTDFERDEIHPPLYNVLVQLMLEELAEVGYVELRDGKAYPGSRA